MTQAFKDETARLVIERANGGTLTQVPVASRV
jgi:hypothetical protein